jgi:hypothetical protein
MADLQTNAALWENVHQAILSGSTQKIASAEGTLADYLALKLGRIEGKQYQTGMTLAAVIDKYNAHLGRPAPWRRGALLARLVLLMTLSVPALVLLAIWARRRRRDTQR